MKKEDAEEYTQSLGQIVAGSWRQIALAKRLGVPKSLGLSTEDWVNLRLGGYVKMAIADRREAVAELADEMSNREIAGVLGVDEGTVRNDQHAENSAEAEDNRNNNNNLDICNAENSAPIDAVAALAADDKTSCHNHRVQGSGENEWYTPGKYMEAARQVMGGIDLDPASNDKAQETIQAATYFTADDNGLIHDWHGRVWLNPPYSRDLIGKFIDQLIWQIQADNVEQAILLTHNYTDTAWFHQAESAASLICFTRGRIAFIDQRSDRCSPTQGQAFFYFGDNSESFRKTFSEFGFIR